MTTKQAPINSGYGATTTAAQVIGDLRLDGINAIVTGGYTGVGLETTRALVDAGATVVVPARSPDKARAALAGFDRVEVETLDLFDPESIDGFAARFLVSRRPLQILIDNAGIMAPPLVRDTRGFESQLATNHLGHFQLTARLWPALQSAHGARVVTLSSRGHARSAFDFDDPNFEQRPYDKWIAYGQSKTANALFALALDRRGEEYGIRAFSVHPGGVHTELMRFMLDEEKQAATKAFNATSQLKTPQQGAATSIWCATSEQLDGVGGVYCEDCDIAVAVPADFPEPRGVRPWACDPVLAERLWILSEIWTEVTIHEPLRERAGFVADRVRSLVSEAKEGSASPFQ